MPPRRRVARAASNAGDVGNVQSALISSLEGLHSTLTQEKKHYQEPTLTHRARVD